MKPLSVDDSNARFAFTIRRICKRMLAHGVDPLVSSAFFTTARMLVQPDDALQEREARFGSIVRRGCYHAHPLKECHECIPF